MSIKAVLIGAGQRGAEVLNAFMGMGESWIEVREHRSGRRSRIETRPQRAGGHGGGDTGLMEAFVRSIAGQDGGRLTLAETAQESYLLAFAAEQARVTGQVIYVDNFRRGLTAVGQGI